MKNKRVLHCSNDLVEAYKLYSPIQLRAFYNLLYLYKYKDLNPDNEGIELFDISISNIASYLGKKHLSLPEIKEFIYTLPTQINFKNKIGFVSVFKVIYYDEEEDCIKYEINERLLPYISDVKDRFTILELEALAELNSKYSQRLYEFICKNKALKFYTMNIDEFRSFFYVPEDYRMCDIDARILKPMIKDINKNTKFEIEIKKTKKRNIVTHLEFIIKEK